MMPHFSVLDLLWGAFKHPIQARNDDQCQERRSQQASDDHDGERALEKFNGNQSQAARYLDISRRTFIYRMEKYGIRQEDPETSEPTVPHP
jgi:DNA-binding NtrC family response regulator